MQIQAPSDKVVADRSRTGNSPLIAVEFDQLAACGQPRQMLQQQTALAPATEAELPHKLLVSSPLTGGALDVADQLAVSHARLRKKLRSSLNHIKPYIRRKDSRMGCNFQASVFKMQTAALTARI